MYGYEKPYEELLEISGLESLQSRRKKLFDKFAEKMSENKNYSDFFVSYTTQISKFQSNRLENVQN